MFTDQRKKGKAVTSLVSLFYPLFIKTLEKKSETHKYLLQIVPLLKLNDDPSGV